MNWVLPVLLSSVLLLVSASTWDVHTHEEHDSFPNFETSTCKWKCLLFTVQWPGGFCQSLSTGTQCRIPESTNSWTIHGLWPVHATRCCKCWTMHPSDVQEVEEELTQRWPSLLKSKSNFHFWKEEWRKHGVCATCVEGMNSPLRYFQICLKLHRQLDIQRFLDDGGITPSCQRPYKEAEVRSVLDSHLGSKYEVQCVTDNQGREVFFQVKTSVSQNLTVSCQNLDDSDQHWSPGPGQSFSPGHPCPPQLPFYYFPINHENPEQPCD